MDLYDIQLGKNVLNAVIKKPHGAEEDDGFSSGYCSTESERDVADLVLKETHYVDTTAHYALRY